jgi:hypothetical protein
MFCEAPADFRLASGLVDRVLREAGPPWVADNFDSPDVVRTWQADGFGHEYFDIHKLDRYADALGVRSLRGHFDGRPGAAGSAMARKAFRIAQALHKKAADEPVDAVVLVWDMDQQSGERLQGVEVARDEARTWAPFQIVCGFPDPEGEAWVLAGFDPCDDMEQQRLEELHRDLGFSPVVEAGRLRDKNRGAPRNIKRVLAIITGDVLDREQRCWTEPPLATLRARGLHTDLAVFLEELEAVIPPLLNSGAPTHRRGP